MREYELTEKGEALNELGVKYVDLVKGHVGLIDKDNKLDYGSRTSEEIDTANEVVMESMKFIEHIASKMIFSKWEIRDGNSVSLRGLDSNKEDLVKEGVISLLGNLHKYNPKYAMTTFIGLRVAGDMYKSASKEFFVDFPTGMLFKAKAMIGESDYVGRESIKDISLRVSKRELSLHFLNAIYDIVSGEGPLNVDDAVSVDCEEGGWQKRSFEYKNNATVEELVYHDELKTKTPSLLSKLNSRHEKVIRGIFGIGIEKRSYTEIGDEFGVTHERVRQIEKVNLKILRRTIEKDKRLESLF